MSTRANIIIKDKYGEELIFYRHSDGYPEGTLPTLEQFLQWVKEGRIRDNVEQSAGWLIIIGAVEYAPRPDQTWRSEEELNRPITEPGHDVNVSGWKVGAYEPATCMHGDIAYLYVVDLKEKVIHIDGEDGYRYSGKYRTKAEATV